MEKNKNTYAAPSTETIVMDLTTAINGGVSRYGKVVNMENPTPGNAGGAHTKEYVLEDVDLWSNEEDEEE